MLATRRQPLEVACNWKLFVEVFMEYYHLEAVHPGTISKLYDPPDPPEAVSGQFVSQFGTNPARSGVLTQDDQATFPAIEGLSGRAARGTRYTLIYPALIMACTADSMWYFELTPRGPARTLVRMVSCFPRSTAARSDFEDIAARYYGRMDATIAEDNAILERQQAGLASPLARPGRLSHLEVMVGAFGRWIAERILEDNGTGAAPPRPDVM